MGLTIKDRLASYRNLPKFFCLVWKVSPRLTLSNILIRVLQAIIPLGLLNVGKYIIDEAIAITHNRNLPYDHLWKLIAVEFIFILLLIILGKVTSLIDELLGERLTNDTTNMIMQHAAKLDLVQFENSQFYDKLERARQQTTGRAILLTHVFSQVQDLITITSYVVVLVAFNPWVIVILLSVTLPSMLGEFYFNNKNYALLRSQTQARRELDYLSLVASSDVAAKEVRLFDLSGFFINKFKNISHSLYEAKRKFGVKRLVISSLISIPGVVGFYLVFFFIVQRVLQGSLTIGGLTLLLGTIRQLGGLMQNSARRFNAVAQGAIYLTDFFDFFKIMPAITVPDSPRPFPDPIVLGFTFENVGFKYGNSDKWANRHLNFTLRPGEKLALVGENGAGKTTLVKLLVRLYDPTEGRITLDGHDLKEYNIEDIRRQMGIIFQDFIKYQMPASVNIAVGDIAAVGEENLIVDAAKQSLAHPIIDRMPGKYQQMLGTHFDTGVELSGGEWQKVALARAYMRNAQIVILDEPTAALDARSEYEVFKRFSDITQKKTAVLISHRFSTVRMADRIIVLDKGEILEIGSHEELLQRGDRYAELFELQAAGYK
ncbi:ABC transporter ATP-binding protein/permease [Mucilaginibacter sp. SMC90]|uniref:ABC transporter ATP-binding protein n=1 Tax=Mucilaginibacter sp. SMC90 TaxID=2929803 RepID=UPI001FB2F967|nr:ABC transporter ATP-binding protein [Mucilaginibacter sp. SMC90]UOE51899.1 ABC transporter ATP-binding protein/permease [Mucilaginibacter sp. SMC90]